MMLVDEPLPPDALRAVLGSFCSGVVVVAAYGERPYGFTCQSFVSLSLTPPLVSFSPARTSTTWPRIRDVGRFCINVLAHDQQLLSDQFARSGTDKFAGVSWRPSPSGSPVLSGVLAWIDCELHAESDGGDHTIVIGAVRALDCDAHRSPLVYYRGQYAPSAGWAGRA